MRAWAQRENRTPDKTFALLTGDPPGGGIERRVTGGLVPLKGGESHPYGWTDSPLSWGEEQR